MTLVSMWEKREGVVVRKRRLLANILKYIDRPAGREWEGGVGEGARTLERHRTMQMHQDQKNRRGRIERDGGNGQTSIGSLDRSRGGKNFGNWHDLGPKLQQRGDWEKDLRRSSWLRGGEFSRWRGFGRVRRITTCCSLWVRDKASAARMW